MRKQNRSARPDKSDLDVSILEEGDEIRAVFEELSKPDPDDDLDYFMADLTGDTYVTTGVVRTYQGVLGESLEISSNGQCLRQGGGEPGIWLVSFEILKKGDV